DIERDDDVLERRIGPALEARRAYHRLDLHCRAGAGMLRFVQVPDAGTTGTLTRTHRSCTLSAAWYAIFQTLPLCNAEFVGFLSRCSSHLLHRASCKKMTPQTRKWRTKRPARATTDRTCRGDLLKGTNDV